MNLRNASTSLCVSGLLLLAACAPPRPPAPTPPDPRPAPPPVAAAAPQAAPAPSPAKGPRRVRLEPPGPARSMDQLKRRAAERLVAAHPEETYTHKAKLNQMAVPVLLVELKADGSVRRVQVLRYPHERDKHYTAQLAIDAIHRAAPYGAVDRLPQPWTFTESFLFDYDGRFKPRSLE